jgi:hypothetical protein
MDDPRVSAAFAELNTTIQMLMQRGVNLAGDVATLQAVIKAKDEEITRLKLPEEPVTPSTE